MEPTTEINITEEIKVESVDMSSSDDESQYDDRSLVIRAEAIQSAVSKALINLFLPFVNGMMLGFGEIFAHELGFKWGFTGARVLPRNNRQRNVQINK